MNKQKFVKPLTSDIKDTLEELRNHHPYDRVRVRAHIIILSAAGFSIEDIVCILNVNRDTVSLWIDRWELYGIYGLMDKERPGASSILTEDEKKLAIELIKEEPRSLKKVIAKLKAITGKVISVSTLKRIAKKARFIWKRVRKSLKSKRNEEKYQECKQDIEELEKMEKEGEIDIYYFDESSCSLTPCMPYAWQPIGNTIELPASKSSNINMLSFLNKDNNIYPYIFDSSVNSSVVVACFNDFSKRIQNNGKETVVIIDNAPTHTSGEFKDNILEWGKRGLWIKHLSPYSPELNCIEILWRRIKYDWLPFSAYENLKSLKESLTDIFETFGSEYRINFS